MQMTGSGGEDAEEEEEERRSDSTQQHEPEAENRTNRSSRGNDHIPSGQPKPLETPLLKTDVVVVGIVTDAPLPALLDHGR